MSNYFSSLSHHRPISWAPTELIERYQSHNMCGSIRPTFDKKKKMEVPSKIPKQALFDLCGNKYVCLGSGWSNGGIMASMHRVVDYPVPVRWEVGHFYVGTQFTVGDKTYWITDGEVSFEAPPVYRNSHRQPVYDGILLHILNLLP